MKRKERSPSEEGSPNTVGSANAAGSDEGDSDIGGSCQIEKQGCGASEHSLY